MNLITVQKIIRENGLSIQTLAEAKTAEEYNMKRPVHSAKALSELEFNSLKSFFTQEAK